MLDQTRQQQKLHSDESNHSNGFSRFASVRQHRKIFLDTHSFKLTMPFIDRVKDKDSNDKDEA